MLDGADQALADISQFLVGVLGWSDLDRGAVDADVADDLGDELRELIEHQRRAALAGLLVGVVPLLAGEEPQVFLGLLAVLPIGVHAFLPALARLSEERGLVVVAGRELVGHQARPASIWTA